MSTDLLWFGPVLALLLLESGEWILRREPREEPGPAPASFTRGEVLYLVAIVSCGVALRLWVAGAYAPHDEEQSAILRACRFAFPVTPPEHGLADLLHAPGQPFLLHLWLRLCDAIGVAQLQAVRFPNLVVSAIAILLMARVGAQVATSRVGLSAATLLALTPFTVRLGTFQENHFAELITTLWFMERGVQYLIHRRPVYRSLAVSAAACVWGGYMTVFVLAPATIVLGVVAARRRQLVPALYTAALVALLLAPLLPIAIAAGVGYVDAHPAASLNDADRVALERRVGHGLYAKGGSQQLLAELLGERAESLFPVGAVLLLLRRRWRSAFAVLVVAAFMLISRRVTLLAVNYGAAAPFLFLVVSWGVDGLLPRNGSRWREWGNLVPHGALLAIALGSSHEARPLARPKPGYAAYRDVEPWKAELATIPPRMPLMFYDILDATPLNYSVCAGAQTACDQIQCAMWGEVHLPSPEGWLLSRRRGREVLRPNSQPEDCRLAPLEALLSRPAWEQGFLVIGNLALARVPQDLRAFISSHCAPGPPLPGSPTWRCPGGMRVPSAHGPP